MEYRSSADFDWDFEPVVTDGKVNVGFKRAGMTPEEAIGEGMQGPVDVRKYYKTQFISPEGNITRTAVYPGHYSWETGVNGLAMNRYTPKKNWDGLYVDMDHLDDIVKRKKNVSYPEGKWLMDANGNWYQSKKDLTVPLSEAREMKKSWMNNGFPMFEGTDMRGKKGEYRVVPQDEQLRMMHEARKNRRRDYDRLAPDERGVTLAYRNAMINADDSRTKAIDDQIDYTFSMNNEREAAIRKQIKALQAQLQDISDEEHSVREGYRTMRNNIRKYSGGAPWHKTAEDAAE